MMTRILLLAGAGAIGALLRYALSSVVQRHTPGLFPLATFVVNLLGCLLFGVIWGLAEERQLLSATARAILLSGFIGAFTTFSSFAYENGQLLRHGHWGMLLANVVLQNVLGVGLVLLGMYWTRGTTG